MRVASRVMHAAIGKLVCSKVKLEKNRFMLGNMAPDAPLNAKNGKDISHFALGVHRDEKAGRYINYEKFIDKYCPRLNDSFFLGYYCHLLADELWHSEIYKKHITPLIEGNEKELLEEYYCDFMLLNMKLINYYGLNKEIKIVNDIVIDEINIDALVNVIKQFNDDFNVPKNFSTKQLRLMKFQDVINYIEKAAELTVVKIEDIRRYKYENYK